MTTWNTTSTRKSLLALLVAVTALFVAALALEVSAQAGSAETGATGAYPWPVKPFTKQHPIRGYFGDPRTVFHGPQTTKTLMAGDGTFSFHQGVDISAPDGSPVYPVASGTVTSWHENRVTVDSGHGRAFQYWHIVPTVRRGQHVVAGRTVLGHIQERREHVHLTHVENGRVVNPLAPGRLTPYRDRTAPQVRLTAVRQVARGSKRVHFRAEAVDSPALPVPGRWNGYPVTPARITWRIERGGRIVVGPRVARDANHGSRAISPSKSSSRRWRDRRHSGIARSCGRCREWPS